MDKKTIIIKSWQSLGHIKARWLFAMTVVTVLVPNVFLLLQSDDGIANWTDLDNQLNKVTKPRGYKIHLCVYVSAIFLLELA